MITKEILNTLFEYRDGMLFWKVRVAQQIPIGARAGTLRETGYRCVTVLKKYNMEHRIIWMFHYGDIPEGLEIDHINEVKDDNRIENLRLATTSQNQSNIRVRKTNRFGFKGAAYHKRDKKWFASIKVNGKRKYLGYYNTPEESHEAYKRAAIELHGEFAKF